MLTNDPATPENEALGCPLEAYTDRRDRGGRRPARSHGAWRLRPRGPSDLRPAGGRRCGRDDQQRRRPSSVRGTDPLQPGRRDAVRGHDPVPRRQRAADKCRCQRAPRGRRRRRRRPDAQQPRLPGLRELQLRRATDRRQRPSSRTSRPPASASCRPHRAPETRATCCPVPRWRRRTLRASPPSCVRRIRLDAGGGQGRDRELW